MQVCKIHFHLHLDLCIAGETQKFFDNTDNDNMETDHDFHLLDLHVMGYRSKKKGPTLFMSCTSAL